MLAVCCDADGVVVMVVVVVLVVLVVGHYEAHSRVSVYQPTFTYWWLVRLGLDRNWQRDYKT